MSHRLFRRATQTSPLPSSPLDRRDAPWLAVTLVTGVGVAVLYLATNPYPAYGAGLYTATADAIRANGYALPETVPGYTAEGVPFAYPPLAFYGLAALRDLGAGTFATARVVPPVLVVAALVPAYLLGRELLDGRARAGAAAVVLAVNPQVLEWHVSAGGLVRATAFLFALWSAYAGLRVFRDGADEWVPAGVGLFALVVLTHPTYALFVVLTDVLFWAGFDRTPRGLGRGAVVGVGGLVLAAPWWLTVASRFGVDAFTSAAGTHGGVGGGLAALASTSPWSAGLLAVGAGLLFAGWRVLPAWLFLAEAAFAQPRFAYAVGAFALVAAAVETVDRVGGDLSVGDRGRRLSLAAIVVVATAGVGVVGYESTGLRDETTPSFVDDEDVDAMAWARAETPPDATFVALGDAAEWFPAETDRTILVSPWGMEWRGPDAYQTHLAAYENASRCQSVECVEDWTATVDADPEYLYVPRGGYTVRGARATNFGTLERSLDRDGRYERVFANEGVAVYRVGEPGGAD